MYWRDIATLVGVKKTVNENGYKVETEARREVFVNKKSATRSEFYAAKQAGDKIAPRPRGARIGLRGRDPDRIRRKPL